MDDADWLILVTGCLPCNPIGLEASLGTLHIIKNIVEILNKLGHSISYPLTCEILTSQAESSVEKSKMTTLLPLTPTTVNEIVLAYFLVDNLDLNIETQYGGGALNITSLVAFQEGIVGRDEVHIPVPRTGSRKVTVEEESGTDTRKTDPRKLPPSIDFVPETFAYDDKQFMTVYILWLYIRKQNAFDQLVSSFSGFITQIRATKKQTITKTVETYLPPINSIVTDFNTIKKYLDFLTGLAKGANMPYVNITIDVGAVMNAFKLIWNFQDEYKEVCLHLGSFHFMKENFQVIHLLL